jgi:hypothetical protein
MKQKIVRILVVQDECQINFFRWEGKGIFHANITYIQTFTTENPTTITINYFLKFTSHCTENSLSSGKIFSFFIFYILKLYI